MVTRLAAAPPRGRRTQPAAYLYLLPVIVAAILFTIIPFIYTAYISFTNYNGFLHFQHWNWVGLANYKEIFARGSEFFPVLGWTVAWMVLSTVLNVGIGAILALLLNNPHIRERGVYRTLLIIPWALPFILLVQVWRGIINTQGPINQILGDLGLHGPNWLESATPARIALLLVNLWFTYPFFMVVCLAALQAIPRDLYEVADLDGAGFWSRLRDITLPFMLLALIPLLITQIAFQFNNVAIIVLLTKGDPQAYPGSQYGSTDILASYAYKLIYSVSRYGLAAAYSIIVFAIIASLTIVNSLVTRAFKEEE